MVLVILDRDGVINQDSDQYIKSPEEWIPIPGSLEAIARLNHAGFLVAVATNQSGLARGLIDLDTLNAMHAKMREQLARVGGHVDGIFFCRMARTTAVTAVNPNPGCTVKSASDALSICAAWPLSVTAGAIWRRLKASALDRSWSGRVRVIAHVPN